MGELLRGISRHRFWSMIFWLMVFGLLFATNIIAEDSRHYYGGHYDVTDPVVVTDGGVSIGSGATVVFEDVVTITSPSDPFLYFPGSLWIQHPSNTDDDLSVRSNVTFNGDVSVDNNIIYIGHSDVTFNGEVTAGDGLHIMDGSNVIFKDIVTGAKEIYIDGANHTVFEKGVSAQVLAIDSTARAKGGANIFKDIVTLSGDGAVESIDGNPTAFDFGMLNGTNIFEKDVILTRADSANTAIFMDSTTTFKSELNVGAGLGSVSIGRWDAVTDWLKEPTNPDYAYHQERFAADPDLYTRTAVVILQGDFAKITAANVSVRNNGILAVDGNASIDGSIRFANGSKYIAAFSASTDSLLTVTGQATIDNGAKADLITSGLTTEQLLGKTILSATGGVTGTGMFSGSLFSFGKVGNSIVVAGIRSTSEAMADVMENRAYSENNKNVAMLYDKVMNDATVSSSLRSSMLAALEQSLDLTESNGAAGNAVFNQLFGLDAIHSTAATRTTGQRFSGEVSGRLSRLRDTRAMAESGVRSDSAFANPEFGCYQDTRNRIWAGGFGTWIRQNDKGGTYGYKYNSGGFILGYDYSIDDFTFGFSGAYSNGSFKNNDGISKSDVDTMNFGLYGSYDPDCGFYADVNLGYGQMWDKERGSFILGGDLVTTSVKFHNHAFQADAHIGYAFKIPGEVRIVPTVGVEYMLIHQKSATKRSNDPAFSNWFESRNTSYIDIPVGMKIARTWSLGGGASITPEVHGAWVYQAGNSRPKLQMGYVGSSSSTIIYGIDSGRSHGLVGAGVKANFNRYVDAFAIYNFEFRSGYKNHNIMAGLGLSF